MEVDYLYFDLGQVLVGFSYDIGARNLARLIRGEPNQIRDMIYLGELQIDFESGRIDEATYAAEINRRLNSSLPASVILETTSAIFWPNLEMIPLISALKSAGLPLGVLSNTCSAHWQFVCHHFPFLQNLFRDHLLSFEVGAMKPDPMIYQAAANLAQTTPDRIFFVDDRMENVAGARQLGFQAILFHSARQTACQLRNLGIRFNY